MRASRWGALAGALLLAAAVAVPAAGDAPPPKPPPSTANSFAPHHTAKRSFGAPIQSQILHKRQPKKPAKAAPTLRSTPLPDAPK
jgi:hypothetical protein